MANSEQDSNEDKNDNDKISVDDDQSSENS